MYKILILYKLKRAKISHFHSMFSLKIFYNRSIHIIHLLILFIRVKNVTQNVINNKCKLVKFTFILHISIFLEFM